VLDIIIAAIFDCVTNGSFLHSFCSRKKRQQKSFLSDFSDFLFEIGSGANPLPPGMGTGADGRSRFRLFDFILIYADGTRNPKPGPTGGLALVEPGHSPSRQQERRRGTLSESARPRRPADSPPYAAMGGEPPPLDVLTRFDVLTCLLVTLAAASDV
jgi:hypothetical protein